MSTWRYVQNGQAVGPVEASTLENLLRNGPLNSQTLVWKEGMPNWVPAGTVPEFAPFGTSTNVPPIPPTHSIPPLTHAPLSDQADIDQNKIFAVLAYLGILFLIPLLAAPKSKFARYHTNQGIILFLTFVILSGASAALFFIPMMHVATGVGMVGAIVLMVMGIINAASGLYKPLPLIGHFKLLH